MKTILLTGATGFLGSHLAKKLIDLDYRVLAFKRPHSSISRLGEYTKEIQWYTLGKDSSIETPFLKHEVEAVIHTATNYGRNGESLSEIIHANLYFPLQLFEACLHYDTKAFINTDTALTKMTNHYSLSKKQLLEWLISYKKNTKIINIKLEHFYGPNEDSSKFISYILTSCIDEEMKELKLTEGEQRRDFIYINDAVSAYIKILEYLDTLDHETEFEVGSGQMLRIREVVNIIKRRTQSEILLLFGSIPYRKHEVMESKADIQKLLDIGWKPMYTFEQGITEMIAKERGHK
jgi:CDP-paratose synthetase